MRSLCRLASIRALGLTWLATLLVAWPPLAAQAAPGPVEGSASLHGLDPRRLPSCAWVLDVSAQTLNVAAPDSNTHYWLQPYVFGPNSSIVVSGTYPFARYISFIAYTADGLPINDVSLHDSQIVPAAGSVNPFTTPNAPTDPSQRRYTVRITPTQPPPTATNTLAGLPAGQTSGLGFVIYRVYLPDTADEPAGGVPLPSLTVDGVPRATCTPAERAVLDRLAAPAFDALVAAHSPDPATVTRNPALFRRAPPLAGLFANPDNQYLYAASDWAPGRVVVVRGKGFAFPDTRHGQSVTTPSQQVRYWSWCSNELANPYPAVQCAADDETVLDAQGSYTVAISMPQDRPRNATKANGVTWLAWQRPAAARASGQVLPNIAYLRNLLPAPGFTQAVQGVPVPAANSTAQEQAAQAAAAMGPYYPVGVYCTKAQFEAQGPASCF
jgi:hypothetical protein